MITLALDIPVEVIRERGFADYIVYTLVALGIAEKIWSWFRPAERKISGTVDTKPAVQHAEKAELLAVTNTVNAMREENAALHRNAQTLGENRVVAITQDVNTKMDGLSMKIGEITKMITTALIDNGTQGEAINNLKATSRNHEQSIAAIHRRIDGILEQPRSKRTS